MTLWPRVKIMRRRFRRWAGPKRMASMSVHCVIRAECSADQWSQRLAHVVKIDGGKAIAVGGVVSLTFGEDLNVCSLAKQREEVFLPWESQPLDSEPDQLGGSRCVASVTSTVCGDLSPPATGSADERSLIGYSCPGPQTRQGDPTISTPLMRSAGIGQALSQAPGGSSLAQEIHRFFHRRMTTPDIASFEVGITPILRFSRGFLRSAQLSQFPCGTRSGP